MKTEDLMIGDWVDVYHELPDESGFYKPLQVTGMHQNGGICFGDSIIESPWNDPEEFEEWVKPIPLTAEILEKNGFIFKHDIFDGIYPMINIIYCDYKLLVDGGKYINGGENNTIHYVHELQHALKLCGIEKEIVL